VYLWEATAKASTTSMKIADKMIARRSIPFLELVIVLSLKYAVVIESFMFDVHNVQQQQRLHRHTAPTTTVSAITSRPRPPFLVLSAQTDDLSSSALSEPETDVESINGQNDDVESLVEETFRDRTSASATAIQLVTLELPDHQPMGCTVEESLDPQDEYVFVSRITKDSNSEKSGMKIGDVVVAMTGPFGNDADLSIVLDAGVEKIKRMVSAVPSDETLRIQVARGTDVFERHEIAVVDICSISESSDSDVEDCVVTFLTDGYYEDIGGSDSSSTAATIDSKDEIAKVEGDGSDDDDDDDTETEAGADGLIDSMMNMWVEDDDLPLPPTTSGITDSSNQQNTNKKPKPWSSRSSPSGTWVRDPKTGQMRNIDE